MISFSFYLEDLVNFVLACVSSRQLFNNHYMDKCRLAMLLQVHWILSKLDILMEI